MRSWRVMRIHVGTSGYNYPEWRGTFYPADLPAKKMFGYYAGRFGTVEINFTFYRMPMPTTTEGWRAQAPDGFEEASVHRTFADLEGRCGRWTEAARHWAQAVALFTSCRRS